MTMNDDQARRLISINSWSIAIQLVILATVIGGIAILTREVRGAPNARGATASSAMAANTNVENWKQYVRSHNATSGSPDALVTILEFTDFQCPYCKNFSDNERAQLLEKYKGKIRFVVKNFPLEANHPEAKIAAIAAQCSNRSGHYWEMERALFANAKVLNEQFIGSVGDGIGLGADFDACLSKRQSLEEVEQDIRDGEAVGIRGTPTFVVNGRVSLGTLPTDLVESALKSSIKL